jgi:prepilin-type N-terminal cleavage/methylation domain-containing protein
VIRKGFTLIECLIYLVLIAFIATISISAIKQLWDVCIRSEKKRTLLINMMAAHDVLLHDLQQAPQTKKKWKICDASCLIWRNQNEEDRGWVHEEGSLFRITGIYDSKKKSWQKKSKNLVAPGIQKVQFTYCGSSEISHIDFALQDSYYTVQNRAILAKRELYE